MKKPFALFALCLATGLARGEGLLDAWQDARQYDAQFAAAEASRTAGQEKASQGRAGLLPVVGLSANTTRNGYESHTSNIKQNYNSHGWTLNLTQPVFRWQSFVGYQQGKRQSQLAELQYAQARQDLILRVAQAYLDVLLAEEALAVAETELTAIQGQLKQAKVNFEVGTATITDTHEAQSRYDLAVAERIAASSDLEVKKRALETVTGKPYASLRTLRDQTSLEAPKPADMASWVTAAGTQSLAVQQARSQADIAAGEAERARAGHFPTLDLVASRGNSEAAYSISSGGRSDTTTSAIALQLNIPLFAGGGTQSVARETAALRTKALADLDSARRSAEQSARQSYLAYTNGLSRIKALEAALVSSQSALDANKLGYEVGVRINLDVLNAQRQLFSTRLNLSRGRIETLLARLRLAAAVGTLDEDDLKALDALMK